MTAANILRDGVNIINDGVEALTRECQAIRKTCPCNVYPLEPHFYIVKLGFAGVYLFSYFCSKT